jgi:hypothetical protein
MLGRGGMAEVHEVLDLQTGKRIAQKRLFPQDEPEKQVKARQLFEREYQTLAQLSHPRIVEVHDFAIDDTGPYYTMELLSGGDLSQLVPMDYRRACRVVKDICSALSLLHSRSMVHRDLSPRNVRCTADGTAKLIDFGAMAPIGRNRSGIVGTPAYCAPEAINGQPLDARTDLYALGATLYYALTGRHAYPAKDFASLPERWQAACPAPSEYVAEIPPALDALVLELLRLDPLARPPSAFEVIARLCAIDGSSYDEQLVVAQAYLSTPTLVGRSAALSAVQRKIHRTDKGRGRGVVVSGSAGVGRSRFLDAIALEVKLRGTIVVGADADDSNEGDYGVVRALARRLIAQVPERVYNAARGSAEVLSHAVPELEHVDGKAGSVPPDRPPVARPVVQQALRDWFVQLGQQASLVVTVDDVHAIDEPSAALLSLLAHDAKGARLLLVTSLDPGATPTAPAAVKLLVDSSEAINLAPLLPEETEQLFRSIFGNGPNVGLLAHRLNGVANGNPRDLMQLAQHLIDRSVIRYETGAWSVPGAFDGRDLPATMAQAFDVRVAALSTEAREIACALSLAVGQTAAPEELQLLSGRADAAQAASSVDELFRAHVLRWSGDRAGLAQEGWARALQAGLPREKLESLHLRLATLFERRGNETFRRGKHLLRGGETDLGVEVLARHAERSQEETGQSPELFFRYMQSLPSDWFQVFQDALRLCDETNRPKRDGYAIRSRLSGMLWMSSESTVSQSVAHLHELADYTGLTAFHEMDPSLDAGVRLKRALGIAATRHAALPEPDRLLDPGMAIRHFGRAVTQVAGVITLAFDMPSLRKLPSVLPFAQVSPVFGVLQMLFDGMGRRFSGRFEDALAIYLKLLDRLAAPDRGGLEPSHQEYTSLGVINGIAMMEAGIGLESVLGRAEHLAKYGSMRVNALQVRMIYQLWQGNAEEANRLRQQLELVQIQDSPRQLWEGTNLLWQVTAYGLSEDMTHLKQTVDELTSLAERYRGWKPVHHYGLGEYHRSGGANEAALSEFQSGLALVSPGDHQMWPHLAGAHLRVLDELGRTKEAATVGEEYVKVADAAGLGYVTNYILMPLAVIQAKTGQKEAAVKTAERALASFAALNSTGLNVGLAHEARARVALLVGDKPEYSRHLALCRDVYTTRGNAALVTKFEKLRRSAQQRKPAVVQPGGGGMGFFTTAATVGTSRLDLCQGPESRANCALSMVMDQCGATAGVLYLVGAHGPFAAASSGKADEVLGTLALEYLMNETGDLSTTGEGSSITTGESQADWTGAEGEKYRPVLLTHEGRDGFLITGVAVVATAPESPFTYPSRVANEVSRHLQRMGDVTGMVVAG